jgi:hypothetical protein
MNAVLTISMGESYKKIAEKTHPSIKAYAEKINAEFICIDQKDISQTTPHWEKFKIYSLLNKYNRIIYLDTDIIIRDDCPNLFDVVPEGELGVFNEAPFTDRSKELMIDICKQYDVKLKKWNGKYYNTGVMVISRKNKEIFKKPEQEIFSFYEQGYLNMIISLEQEKDAIKIFELTHYFNRMTCMDRITGEERFNSYIIHYAGYPNIDFLLSLIPKDLQRWEINKPNYKYQRHILINVQGGLGDQVCAEPAIRFMKTYIYPEEDINVATHFPELFEHIEGINVFNHNSYKLKNDVPYYETLSLPGPDKIMWTIVSHLLCHSADYTAMALLKRTLPNEDKRIYLNIDENALNEVKDIVGENINDLVLVHAGRHWESKTFPVAYWQEIIDKLVENNFRVCLIGKEDETRGTVQVKVKDGVIDSRNLLSLKGLIALISQAKVLISNDSAPIHLAGAFDNGIILIPTCKHPDHLLPYRYGTQYYRATYLCKKIMSFDYNSQPTSMLASSADYLTGNWEDYLPDTDIVVETTKQIYDLVTPI